MSFPTTCKVAIVAALEREVRGLIKKSKRVEREFEGRNFVFYEQDDLVVVCGGIGSQPARRAAEAVIALYRPALLQSVGFAGALHSSLRVGDMIVPAVVVDARDGSRTEIASGKGILVTFMTVATVQQKGKLAQAFNAQAVDMEAAAVASAANVHGIAFTAAKVISDEINFELPQMETFIDSRGYFRSASFALFVAMRPWLWTRVIKLAGNTSKAARMLTEHLKNSTHVHSDAAEAKIT